MFDGARAADVYARWASAAAVGVTQGVLRDRLALQMCTVDVVVSAPKAIAASLMHMAWFAWLSTRCCSRLLRQRWQRWPGFMLRQTPS